VKIDLEIKKTARFIFFPALLKIVKAGRKEKQLADMVEIGNSLGFDRNLTENIERCLISEKLITPSQHGGILLIDGKKVAMSALGRAVTEIRTQTIFTVFENQELKTELECWAGDHGCQITVGESIPDIIALPYFVSLIDRTLLDTEAWNLYLEYRAVEDTDQDYVHLFKACIIVDGIRNMKLPDYDPVFCFDLRDKHSIQLIIKSVELAKNIVDKG
jgi:hypothetical protein